MYMPSSGVRGELRDMATQLARFGYAVFLPNVYYRMARVVDIDANRLFDEDYAPVKTFMNALNNGYSNVLSVTDTAAMLEFVDTQPYVNRRAYRRHRLLYGWKIGYVSHRGFPDTDKCHGITVRRQIGYRTIGFTPSQGS